MADKSTNPYAGRATQQVIGAFSLTDVPKDVIEKFQGYFRNTDPTVLPPNCLTFPSINCFIPNKDKIVPREGTALLGAAYTDNWPIVGHKKRFATMGGYEVEVRVVKSDDADLRDILEVYYPNPATGVYQWYQFSQNTNPHPVGLHRYYFDDWFDTNLNPAESFNLSRLIWVNGLPAIFSWTGGIAPIVSIVANTSISTTAGVPWASLGFPNPSIGGTNFIIINGDSYTITGGWETDTLTLADTTGISINDVAFSPIVSGTIPQQVTLTFSSLSGTFQVGETITGGTSGATGVITAISSSGGILNLDIATVTGTFQVGETITGGTSGATATVDLFAISPLVNLDVCRNNKNYMFYGNWNSRKLFMSNGFNRDAFQEITAVHAVQNDLVLGTSPYTGTGYHTYRVTIDSVNPDINEQVFLSTGPEGLNDATFNTSTYSGAAGVTNIYKIVVVADFTIVVPDGSIVGGPFEEGEVIIGATSKATARIVSLHTGAVVNTTNFAVVMLTGSFQTGETITGQNSAATGGIGFETYQNYIQYFKNGVLTTVTSGAFTFTTVPIFTASLTINLSDNISIIFGSRFGHSIGDTFQLTIRQGGTDTFLWQLDDAAPTTGVPITGASQSLGSLGIQISFVSKTGHTLGDTWTITVNQKIRNAWMNFYYTLPIRRPGEGYIYQLSSNFWTMAPQESEMYVNTKFGEWSYVETVLSADLQSETVSLTPLKQVSSSKVLFPYMIDYLDDTLIYVTENKTLDMIGRKELLQLPQTTNMSQDVALDFADLSFEDGSMEYLDKRLFITSPKQGAMLVYDNQPNNHYWQPPQVIPENGILSIIGNTLISHSNLRNQSFSLFTGKNGDVGSNYTVRARSSYLTFGNRWGWKNSNMSFIEGYVSGLPPMKMNVYLGINGCGGIRSHDIAPVVCVLPDQAPFGEGNLGSHQNGSDTFNPNPHFNEIYENYRPILQFRLAAVELECTATNHSYSWLSFGLNAVIGNKNNIDLKNRGIISRE